MRRGGEASRSSLRHGIEDVTFGFVTPFGPRSRITYKGFTSVAHS
jgi:hypothetical protein